ncbi:MAG: hypothetical protein K6T65_07385 [Peptococcaceae bacterium]|nr:hypothetical protein [Peptococcaceae bacterium]
MMLRLLLALIYLYAGLTKAINPVLFRATIASYFQIPDFAALALAVSFPWLEIIAALSLIFNWKAVYGSGFLFLLSISFFALLVLHYNNVLPYGCGCFGFGGPEKISIYHIFRDFLITLLAGIVFFKSLKMERGRREKEKASDLWIK